MPMVNGNDVEWFPEGHHLCPNNQIEPGDVYAMERFCEGNYDNIAVMGTYFDEDGKLCGIGWMVDKETPEPVTWVFGLSGNIDGRSKISGAFDWMRSAAPVDEWAHEWGIWG